MKEQEHKQKHAELHKAFDELVADFIIHTERGLGSTTVLELIQWSHGQTISPTPNQDGEK